MSDTPQLVEVARSFTYKYNAGNYESRDFFCSQKAEIPEKDAEKKSEELYEFCRKEVAKSVALYLEEERKKADIQPVDPTKVKKVVGDWKERKNAEDTAENEAYTEKQADKETEQLPIIQI